MKLDPNNGFQLQDFGKSWYHRPNDATVEIPVGPVVPYPLNEDGTPDFDDSGETQKRPSIRRRRTIFTMATAAFTVGALMLILSSPYSHEFLAPGPLHSSHAQLLAGQGADRCSACHDASTSSSAFGWVAHAFSGASHKMSQSQLCLECHKANINEQFALNPHNVAPSELTEKTAKFKNASFIGNLTASAVDSNNQIACRACHREHKSELDLKSMTDAQCQSCHAETWHSFEKGHPEFTSWPSPRSQNIAFDHATHFGQHFPSKSTKFDCNQCHLDDTFQDAKVQAPFEQACAACHEQEILDSGQKGIQLFALPMLDMQAIDEAGMQVGTWPMAATGAFDGVIPGAMRTLLMADAEAKAVLDSKPTSFEFADFNPGSKSDVKDAVTLAWATKKLLHELATSGSSALRHRLEVAFQRSVDFDEADRMLQGLDAGSFQAVARRWLPGLSREIETKFGDTGSVAVSELKANAKWLARTRMQDQLAINPLKQSGLSSELSIEANDERFNESEDLIEDPGQIEDPGRLELPEFESNTTPTAAESAGQPSPSKETPSFEEPATRNIPDPVSDGKFAKQPRVLEDKTGPRLSSDKPGDISPPENQSVRRKPKTGWVRDDKMLAIVYRPAGHQDAFLKSWIDAVSATENAEQDSCTASLLNSLTGEYSAGNCRYCHTLKRQSDRTLTMNWKAQRRDASTGSFTSFSHRPHLIQPQLQDCTHCHQLDPTVSNKESFASLDPCECKSNFQSLGKATCTQCHQKGLTKNSCTMCHDYHIGGHKTK